MPVIFQNTDYQLYLDLLVAVCDQTKVQIWAHCPMLNHIQLILLPNHVDGLRAALGETPRRYTLMFNERAGWRGDFWQERFH